MVLPEVLDQIVLHGLTHGALDEVKVLIQEGVSKDLRQELDYAVVGIVLKSTVTAQERDDSIIINLELLSLELVGLNICRRRIRICNMKARTIQPVPAHHTADGVADELFDQHIVVPDNLVTLERNFTLL